MNKINLQKKAQAREGRAEKYWFKNDTTGLEKTLFYRITIPLTPFNSGLNYESQPVETEIVIEWLNLHLVDPDDLDNLQISSQEYEDLEASIYVGSAHNACEVIKLHFQRMEGNNYQVKGEIRIDFKSEGVAQNEVFSFQTIIYYQKNEEY
ncbi:MAG: hypothetical protein J0M29_17560 [Chitinophagales bacterium]|nr:hypothetical protein [Chitinophagales bacterium]